MSIKSRHSSALMAGTVLASIVSLSNTAVAEILAAETLTTEIPTEKATAATLTEPSASSYSLKAHNPEAHSPKTVPDLLTERTSQSTSLTESSTESVSEQAVSAVTIRHLQPTGIDSDTETINNNDGTIYTEQLVNTEIDSSTLSQTRLSQAPILQTPIPQTLLTQTNITNMTESEWASMPTLREPEQSVILSPVILSQTEPVSTESISTTPKFGKAGTQRWYLQAGAAADFDDDAFLLAGAGISHFFYDGHSANLELNGLSVSQPGDDALGATLTFLVRSHWIRGENWSIYVDGGAGIIFTTNDVPEAGSSFNFTPQIGGGASFAINENQRIMTGLRWYHISNADTFESNPGLDTVFGYVGINFPL